MGVVLGITVALGIAILILGTGLMAYLLGNRIEDKKQARREHKLK